MRVEELVVGLCLDTVTAFGVYAPFVTKFDLPDRSLLAGSKAATVRTLLTLATLVGTPRATRPDPTEIILVVSKVPDWTTTSTAVPVAVVFTIPRAFDPAWRTMSSSVYVAESTPDRVVVVRGPLVDRPLNVMLYV
jgi:hypothetical protein